MDIQGPLQYGFLCDRFTRAAQVLPKLNMVKYYKMLWMMWLVVTLGLQKQSIKSCQTKLSLYSTHLLQFTWGNLDVKIHKMRAPHFLEVVGNHQEIHHLKPCWFCKFTPNIVVKLQQTPFAGFNGDLRICPCQNWGQYCGKGHAEHRSPCNRSLATPQPAMRHPATQSSPGIDHVRWLYYTIFWVVPVVLKAILDRVYISHLDRDHTYSSLHNSQMKVVPLKWWIHVRVHQVGNATLCWKTFDGFPCARAYQLFTS